MAVVVIGVSLPAGSAAASSSSFCCKSNRVFFEGGEEEGKTGSVIVVLRLVICNIGLVATGLVTCTQECETKTVSATYDSISRSIVKHQSIPTIHNP